MNKQPPTTTTQHTCQTNSSPSEPNGAGTPEDKRKPSMGWRSGPQTTCTWSCAKTRTDSPSLTPMRGKMKYARSRKIIFEDSRRGSNKMMSVPWRQFNTAATDFTSCRPMIFARDSKRPMSHAQRTQRIETNKIHVFG